MRTMLLGVLVGVGLAAAAIVPAFACPYKTDAAADQSHQTAQAQPAQQTE